MRVNSRKMDWRLRSLREAFFLQFENSPGWISIPNQTWSCLWSYFPDAPGLVSQSKYPRSPNSQRQQKVQSFRRCCCKCVGQLVGRQQQLGLRHCMGIGTLVIQKKRSTWHLRVWWDGFTSVMSANKINFFLNSLKDSHHSLWELQCCWGPKCPGNPERNWTLGSIKRRLWIVLFTASILLCLFSFSVCFFVLLQAVTWEFHISKVWFEFSKGLWTVKVISHKKLCCVRPGQWGYWKEMKTLLPTVQRFYEWLNIWLKTSPNFKLSIVTVSNPPLKNTLWLLSGSDTKCDFSLTETFSFLGQHQDSSLRPRTELPISSKNCSEVRLMRYGLQVIKVWDKEGDN